jgi:hypothetical protein
MWVVPDGVVLVQPTCMRIYNSIVKLIEELDPSTVVVDGLLSAGSDACHSLNRRFVVSAPTPPADVAKEHQPWLKGPLVLLSVRHPF